VDLIDDDKPTFDVCIDDTFGAFLEDDVDRGAAAIPFILHLLGRPLNPNEPTPRDDLVSLKKMLAEGTPSKTLTILGWAIDTRRMLIHLPPDKAKAWTDDIKSIIDSVVITKKDLERLIGRLNHIGYVIPLARHFLNRIRSALTCCESANRQKAKLTTHQLEDLQQWLQFMQQANDGINLNLIAYRHPTTVIRADACLHGIGGASLSSGIGWRYELPPELRGRVSLNCLECLGNYTGMLIEDHCHGTPDLACHHCQGDSTSASGWMHLSNFPIDGNHDTHIELSRAQTNFTIEKNCCISTQWFPGDDNNVADCLSRDFHLSNYQLTALLRHFVPDQLPNNFVIKPIPNKISSIIASLLLSSK